MSIPSGHVKAAANLSFGFSLITGLPLDVSFSSSGDMRLATPLLVTSTTFSSPGDTTVSICSPFPSPKTLVAAAPRLLPFISPSSDDFTENARPSEVIANTRLWVDPIVEASKTSCWPGVDLRLPSIGARPTRPDVDKVIRHGSSGTSSTSIKGISS